MMNKSLLPAMEYVGTDYVQFRSPDKSPGRPLHRSRGDTRHSQDISTYHLHAAHGYLATMINDDVNITRTQKID